MPSVIIRNRAIICRGPVAGIGDVSVLLDWLREMGVALIPEIARRMCRFDWTTDLRYETGRKVSKSLA